MSIWKCYREKYDANLTEQEVAVKLRAAVTASAANPPDWDAIEAKWQAALKDALAKLPNEWCEEEVKR